jgi:hypothetical protein
MDFLTKHYPFKTCLLTILPAMRRRMASGRVSRQMIRDLHHTFSRHYPFKTCLLTILPAMWRGMAAGRVRSQRMREVGTRRSQLVSPASASEMAVSKTAHTFSGTELSLAICR